MAVCPLILKFLHISPQKWLVFANYFGLQNFLPQLPNFFTRIYPSYPWHFPTLLVLHTSCSKICTNTEVFQKISNLKFPENTLVPVPSKFISVLPGLVIDLAIFLWRTTSTKCRRLNKLLKKEKNIRPMMIIGCMRGGSS